MTYENALRELDAVRRRIHLDFFCYLRSRDIIRWLYDNGSYVDEIENSPVVSNHITLSATRMDEDYFRVVSINVLHDGTFYTYLFKHHRPSMEILTEGYLPLCNMDNLRKGVSFLTS